MKIFQNHKITNSLKIDSISKFYVEINSKDEFLDLYEYMKDKDLDSLVIGEGTNLVPPNFFDVMCLGFVAILATIGHYAMTQSFRLTPMTISQPVTYLQLVWATIMGIYLFGDMFDIYVIIGGAMITLSATVIAYLDTRNVSESI